MSEVANEPEPELTSERVASLLAAQFEDLNVDEVRPLGAGQDFTVFECAGLAFRFPRRKECATWLETEIRALRTLGPRLGVAVPRYVRVGRPGPDFPFVFGGYPYLGGQPATGGPASARLAADLGRLLTALHGADPKDMDVPRETRLWAPRAYRERVRSEVTGSLTELPVLLRDACLAFLDSNHEPVGPADFRLVHGDLEAEHLLVDDDGALAGVLDWSDVCVSDPARDLGGLWAWGGEWFLAELLHHYDVPRDPEFVDRVRFLGRCFSLLDYREALDEGEVVLAHARRQLETAFLEAA